MEDREKNSQNYTHNSTMTETVFRDDCLFTLFNPPTRDCTLCSEHHVACASTHHIQMTPKIDAGCFRDSCLLQVTGVGSRMLCNCTDQHAPGSGQFQK